MKIRWFAAGIAAVLITGGAATVAQRVITQKTRGVLPARNDSAHADSRVLSIRGPLASAPPIQTAPATSPPLPLVSRIEPSGPEIEPTADPLTLADAPPPSPPIEDIVAAPPLPETVTETAAIVDAGPDPATTSEAPTNDPALAQVAERSDPAVPITPRPAPALADPVETVESFVERNRQEAESNIQALTTEAENLKTRLAKVEVALVRWQSFAQALHANQANALDQAPPSAAEPVLTPIIPSPGKANWKRTTEPTKRPADSPPTPPTHEPIQEVSAPSAPPAALGEPLIESEPPAFPPASVNPPPASLPPGDLPQPGAGPEPTDLPPPGAGPEPTDLPPPGAGPEPTDLPPPGGVAVPLPLS